MLNAKCRKQHILRPLRKFPLYETSPQSAHTYTQARRHTALACFLPGFQLNSYAENEALKKKKKEYNDKPEVQTGFQLQYRNIFKRLPEMMSLRSRNFKVAWCTLVM